MMFIQKLFIGYEKSVKAYFPDANFNGNPCVSIIYICTYRKFVAVIFMHVNAHGITSCRRR